MTENMKKFFALAKENEELSEKLKNGLTTEELTALAKEQGITLTEEDFSTPGGTQLSDEELDEAAGGENVRCCLYEIVEECLFCGELRTWSCWLVRGRDSDFRLHDTIPYYCNTCGKTHTSWMMLSVTRVKEQ